ncbi:hypothetical protein BTA51_26240 [Hahella sp. CCB-MM4]|uniref:CRISPR system precrRNA processing endoribonuclease RAMP protein Cas6 n=1 Tax=Hahella sp. (strain CCB-MM4) TaxID=1926491 RepID=UPI000B9B4AC0|nr:CRISPR system precrRNA processing endoribonuclease RAMP protein Cas6 [Hahella sp. CCB-MM4]OZG70346.1 hypothetical protein BTA51_26240 [Hahella sp. CCB-MM4]
MEKPQTEESLLPLETLLPLRAMTVTLRFTTEAHFSFFHQPALYAFLCRLTDTRDHLDTLFTLDAPESGRGTYVPGDCYRFVVYAFAGAELLLAKIMARLHALPEGLTGLDDRMPLRDNLMCVRLEDLWTGATVTRVKDLFQYSAQHLADDTGMLRGSHLTLRWLSPVRLLRDKARREGLKGEQRYCRCREDLTSSLLADRTYDALADLIRRRGVPTPARSGGEVLDMIPEATQLFWVDASYRNDSGQSKPVGGLCGEIQLATDRLSHTTYSLFVLGQYTGIGQRRAFGLGRYQLFDSEGVSALPVVQAATPLLERNLPPASLSGYPVIAARMGHSIFRDIHPRL